MFYSRNIMGNKSIVNILEYILLFIKYSFAIYYKWKYLFPYAHEISM